MRFAKFLQRRLFAEIRTAFWIEVNFLVFRPPPPLLVEEKLNIRIYVYGIYIYIYIYIYGSWWYSSGCKRRLKKCKIELHQKEIWRPWSDGCADVPHFPAHKTQFFPEKYDLNSICVLCAEGKYFQTYKYPYIYYTSLSSDSENNHEDDFSGSDDDFLGFYDE